MKNYRREYPLFSLCGLNCGLCPMHHASEATRCPGCGGEDFAQRHPTCAVVSCSQRHGGVEYCFQCDEYPCKKYACVSEYDSFITYRNVLRDFDRAKRAGLDAYQSELNEKVEILRDLLERCNDGRRKSFLCTAVNLLALDDVKEVARQIAEESSPDRSIKENAATAVRLFEAMAQKRGVSLKLNRKKPNKPDA